MRFPKIPGMEFPRSMPQNWRMDYGSEFLSNGVFSIQPPKLGPAYTVLVPQVDPDGNDLGGIALPFLAVPLGTYTGWNYELPRLPSLDYLAGLIGGFQPFRLTKGKRLSAGDPRASVEERYKGRRRLSSSDSRFGAKTYRTKSIKVRRPSPGRARKRGLLGCADWQRWLRGTNPQVINP